MKKKLISLMLLLIMTVVLIINYQDVESGMKKHSLTTTQVSMTVNEKICLNIPGVQAKKVKWISSKKSVASVSRGGIVSAVKAGKAKITGTYKGIKFYCNVTVNDKIYKYNKTIYNDSKMKIVLKSISSKKIIFNVYNKTSKSFDAGPSDYLKLDNKAYYPDDFCVVWPVAPNSSREIVSSINVSNPNCSYISLIFTVMENDDVTISNVKIK